MSFILVFCFYLYVQRETQYRFFGFNMRVNGSLLAKCLNQRVSLIGNVQMIHPGNSGFNITTSDQRSVSVHLQSPLGDTVTGLVEVHGVAQGPSSIASDYYITFPYNLASTYDAELDNEAVNLAYNIPNAWK